MAITILNEKSDPDRLSLAPLKNRKTALIGYGNQGSAHALNLQDSGIDVIVGNRLNSPNALSAKEQGFEVLEIADAVALADLVIIGLPDEVQPEVYESLIAPNLRPGSTIGFMHGFSICYNLIKPAEGIGVVMVAPKGPGTTLRELYLKGLGLPSLFALHKESANNDAETLGLSWATGIGSGRSGVILTTFSDETETDLFGEQAVICGGLTFLILAAYETLVEAGYPSELAYLECGHEVKQVADLLYARGLAGMNKAISNTAEFGSFSAGPQLIDEQLKSKLRTILNDIQNGVFTSKLREDYAQGFLWFNEKRGKLANHPIEKDGKVIRNLMPWLDNPSSDPPETD